MDLKDLKIFEAKLLSIKFKRFICRHRYYVIADNKLADAGLWKCEKCGDLMFQHRKVAIRKQHYNDRVEVEDWISWPSGKELTKGELDE